MTQPPTFGAFSVLFAALAALTSTAPAARALTVDTLRCEYRENPPGIDVLKPRLTWILHAPERGQVQTAYQVLVASSPVRLQPGRADLWDGGKVASSQSIFVEYGGKPLQSLVHCWWKVRAWDGAGKVSTWSSPAEWSMGLLTPAAWHAQWIGGPPPVPSADEASSAPGFGNAEWIWLAEPGLDPANAPAGVRYFRHKFTLAPDVQIKRANLVITADDEFKLFVNGRPAGASDGKDESWKHPQVIDLKAYLQPGENVIAAAVTNGAVGPTGLLANLQITPTTGAAMTVKTDGSWKAGDHEGTEWQSGQFDDAAWPAAKSLGKNGVMPWGDLSPTPLIPPLSRFPSPMFRKTFSLRKPVRSATMTVCGLGYNVVNLNGRRVGDHVLDPIFTRYDRRALYVTHDVTGLLKPGANAVAVQLGNGWYNEFTKSAWNFDSAPWRDTPRLLLQVDVTYTDGTTDRVVSDGSWKTSTGPVVYDAIRKGENYDARLEKAGWDTAAYNDSAWKPAPVVPGPKGILSAEMSQPIRVTQILQPVKLTSPKPGVWLFDLGQDFAGRARLTVNGPAGTEVTLRYGERLGADGTVDQSAIAEHVHEPGFGTCRYILKGGGPETWAPEFAYFGFQYVEVTGFPGVPTLASLQGEVMQTSFDQAGDFECSNPLLNQIERCTQWSYRSNFVGYPTDCPHREKNGWTGDSQLASEMGLLHYGVEPAYTQWMLDFYDEQKPSGELPGIVPTGGWGYAWGNGPAWDSAYILIPWYMYQYSGDTRILSFHYDHFKRYVDYLTGRAKDHLVSIGLGDWVPAKTSTPEVVTSTGYYYADTLIVSKIAALLGKADDARRYSQLAGEIRTAFNAAFYHPDTGSVANGSQTSLSCALYQGLAEPDQKEKITAALAANVDSQTGHLDTGILGAKYLLHALTDNGRVDEAYRVATQTTAPGWGAWMKQGATTLWEQWNGSASRNHIMFGDISAWFIEDLAGIRPDPEAPGFKQIIIRPRPVGDLTWARAYHDSPYGRISSSWKRNGSHFALDVDIPVNTTATIYIPAIDEGQVGEGGQLAERVPGIKIKQFHAAGGYLVLEVGTGHYSFTSRT